MKPLAILARGLLSTVPLETYLAARQKFLTGTINRNSIQLQKQEALAELETGDSEIRVEGKASDRQFYLEDQLFLTEKVAGAAQISLTRVF